METTDRELIERWARGQDAEAFRELVNRHAGMVFSTSWRVLGNTADAEDLTQESFLKLCQLRRPVGNVAAWLHRVATNGAIDVMRARSARRAAERRWESPAAGRELAWQDIEPYVDEAVNALPEDLRTPLILYYLRSETQDAIAASLGLNQGTVSHRVRKGVEKIRRHLKGRGLAIAPVALSGWLASETARAAPASLLARLGKVALLGHGAGRARGSAASAGAEAGGAAGRSFVRGAPLKIALASIAGIVAVGSIALLVLTSWGVPDGVSGGLANAPPEPAREETAVESSATPASPAAPAGAVPQEDAPPPQPIALASAGGTIRDENDAPVAFAEVYLALTPPRDDEDSKDILSQLASTLGPEYYSRARFLETRTDAEGRYLFEEIAERGVARLGAFKEDHAGPWKPGSGTRANKSVTIEEGAALRDVDLVMGAGRTLTGRILAADGSPVADAVVSVPTAWTRADHIFWPAGLAPTDADGRFRLGFEARAAGCHLRVNSASHGQDFFIEVPVTDEPIELTLNELARVEGTITWSDGTPASGLTVTVNGRLPEPPIPVSRMGMRSFVVHDGPVGDDGRYAIEGLHPGLSYDIFVVDGSLGETEARKKPLTPAFREFFRLGAGETKVWDRAVSKPITVRGQIRTAATGTPVPEGQVGVKKDGKRLALISVWADADGFFELRLDTGPGEYRIHADAPVGLPTSDDAADLIDEQFGKTLRLASGAQVEVDLTIFEPAVLPIRVRDHAGEPVKSIRRVLHVTLPNGGKLNEDAPVTLDENGRARTHLYYPATEVWYEIGAFPRGPTVETLRYAATPGAVLPEATVTLPRACDLKAVLRDASGEPHEERAVHLRVTYDDGSRTSFTLRTDAEGVLVAEGRVRAAPFTVELELAGSGGAWKSERLDGSVQGVVDLGEIVLEAKDE